ncbi:class I SAM-dependent methyltransferase [Desulfoplanes sp.]
MQPPDDRSAEYQSVAPFYDLIISPLLLPEYRTAQTMADHIGAKTVVDLCCGTGALARRLADKGAMVTGVDLSRDMLKQAHARNHPNLTFIRKNAAWTSLPTDNFDLAVISMALHEKPAPLRGAIIAEARRLISPAGHILLVDYTRPTTLIGRSARSFAALIERLAGKEHHAHYRSFIAAGGLDHLIAQTGLDTIDRHTFHMGLIQVCLTQLAKR